MTQDRDTKYYGETQFQMNEVRNDSKVSSTKYTSHAWKKVS